MNCPFCQLEMWTEERKKLDFFYQYSCNSINCMVNNDFPRYLCGTDKDDNVCWQEYALGDFYVKVSDYGSLIYKLTSCMLEDEVKISRPLWLNPTNFDHTLDKLKLMVTFS